MSSTLPTQLAGQIREHILSGTVPRGYRLPSSRALAADLSVSRATVEQCYEQLIAEGWLDARRGSGTFVGAPPGPTPGTTRNTPTPSRPPTTTLISLDTGTPRSPVRDAGLARGWRRAWRQVSMATPPPGYDHPLGLAELREALAERLARTRGLNVEPDQIVVTTGTTDALRQLLPELPPGSIAIEDPGFRAAVETVRLFGREVVDLPAAERVHSLDGSVAAYVTPAHQHPLGRVMPATDRLALIAAAQRAEALIIEDDYDFELRYDVAPVPALASLQPGHVAYIGTAAKSVMPSIRLGWLVAPPTLLEPISRRRILTHAGAAWPSQMALLNLLREGWVDKAIRSARRVYAERAARVAAAMEPHAVLAGPSAGMYSTWLLSEAEALRAQDAARAAGFRLNLLADYSRSSGLRGIVIGFGGLTNQELDAALDAITGALRF